MSGDRPQATDPVVAAQLAQWQDAVGAPPARGAWRGPAKYIVSALLLLSVLPLAVRFLVFSPLVEAVGAYGVLLAVVALPMAIVYAVFRILR